MTSCDPSMSSSEGQNLKNDIYSYIDKSEKELNYLRKSSDALGSYSRTTLTNLQSILKNTDSLNKQSQLLLSYSSKIDIINDKSDSLLIKTNLVLYQLNEVQKTTQNIDRNVENINRILTSEKWDELVDGLHRMLRVLQHYWTIIFCLILLFLGYYFKPQVNSNIEKIKNSAIKNLTIAIVKISENLIKSLAGISFATIILNLLSHWIY